MYVFVACAVYLGFVYVIDTDKNEKTDFCFAFFVDDFGLQPECGTGIQRGSIC